ncbi:GPW/gp25 family protein [Novosphingobium sp.]|uniref:GPW/gp25 family protein n=1 Tax=Novosphingobium sp. TaxID=1874826 RepID=UPI002FDCA49B
MTSLTGMNRATGAPLKGDEHLVQSCEDIVTTPLGTRIMERDYGCLLAELTDRPLNRATLLLASMAIAIALARWEPRIVLRQVVVSGDFAAGQATAEIVGTRAGSTANALTRLTIPLARLAAARPSTRAA